MVCLRRSNAWLRRATALLAAGLLLGGCATQPPTPPQHAVGTYPIHDGIKATVMGTPPAWRAKLPDDVPIKTHALAPLVDRSVPVVLEYATPLEYTAALQDEPAPLVFVISGTGAAANSAKCHTLLRALYAAGDSAVCLPSPTSVNFMVGAAPQPMPGYMPADVAAIYALMQAVQQDLADQAPINGYMLAGYSLGATEAAFVAHYDQQQGVFDFRRTLLINPAVDLWASVQRMDALIKDNLPGGVNGVPGLLATILAKLKHPYTGSKPLHIDRQTLFRATLSEKLNHHELAAVVGLTFRLSLANMAFAADVLTDSGVIVPQGVQLGIGDSLDPYLRKSFDMTFADYITNLLLPYWNRGTRTLTRQQLVDDASLHKLRHWLANNPHIAVLTNADDPILGDGDLAFLRTVFGARAHINAHGGHMGNLQSRSVINRIQSFFKP